MGQKCNPTGLRIGVIKNWDSRWYAKKGRAYRINKRTSHITITVKELED